MIDLMAHGTKRATIIREHERLQAFRVFHDFGLLREIGLSLLLLADEHDIAIPADHTTGARHQRVRAVEAILMRTRPWPGPILELTERLMANAVLDKHIQQKLAGRNVRGLRRDELQLDIKVKLLLITLRNSFFWYEQHWYGFIQKQLPKVTGRAEMNDRLRELLWEDFSAPRDP